MLTQEVAQRVERLLAEGTLSQRTIARLVGVSRGTVGRIADGRRPNYEELRRRRQQQEASRKTGLPRRCAGCGALVAFSCLACELRRNPPAGTPASSPARFDRSDETADLELRGEHRRRYEWLRAQRLTQHEPQAPPDEEPEPMSCEDRGRALSPRRLREALECDDELPGDEQLFLDDVTWDD